MKRIYIIFLSCVILIGFASCEKELEIEYHEIPALSVIEGTLTTDGIRVGITQTTPMGEPMDETLFTDAEVVLTDLTSSVSYMLTPDSEGYYCDPTPGIEGHKYLLTVDREDCHYETETEMYGLTEIESLQFIWVRMPDDDMAVLQGTFIDDPDITQYYWIRIYRNGKFYQWAEKDDRASLNGFCGFQTTTTHRDPSKEEEESVIVTGDIVTCTVCQISEEMHDYLEALKNNGGAPTLFNGDKCLGYFMATSPATESIVFDPDKIVEYEKIK